MLQTQQDQYFMILPLVVNEIILQHDSFSSSLNTRGKYISRWQKGTMEAATATATAKQVTEQRFNSIVPTLRRTVIVIQHYRLHLFLRLASMAYYDDHHPFSFPLQDKQSKEVSGSGIVSIVPTWQTESYQVECWILYPSSIPGNTKWDKQN